MLYMKLSTREFKNLISRVVAVMLSFPFLLISFENADCEHFMLLSLPSASANP